MILNNNPIFIDPELWGNHYWYVIETIILSMDNREVYSKESIRLFFYSLQNLLPCPTCREHFHFYFKKNNIDNYIHSKKKMFLWIYQLRKEIQIRNKKPYPTYEEYLQKIDEIPLKYNNKKKETNVTKNHDENFISL